MKKCGIYMIKNNINGKSYIGYSIDIINRWKRHCALLSLNKHSNKHLQSSVNKFGLINFSFIVLERCKKRDLCRKEHFWVIKMKTCNRMFGYNILQTDINGRPPKINKEIKDAISTTIWKKFLLSGNINQLKHTEGIHRPDLALFNKNRKKLGYKATHNGKHSKKSIKKMILAKKPKMRAVLQYSLKEKFIKEYSSLKHASRLTGIFHQNILLCCQGKVKTSGGYIWKYKTAETSVLQDNTNPIKINHNEKTSRKRNR